MRAFFDALFGPLDRVLAAVPMEAARWCTVAFLVAATVAVLLLPEDYVYLGSPDRRRIRDLRLWGVVVMVPYILIYALV